MRVRVKVNYLYGERWLWDKVIVNIDHPTVDEISQRVLEMFKYYPKVSWQSLTGEKYSTEHKVK